MAERPQTNTSLLQWEEFCLVRKDREARRNKRGGGICIYIRSSFKFEIINDVQETLDANIEFVHIKLKPHMQKTINLVGVYRPPDGKLKEFVQIITGVLDQIDRTQSETLLIGDFNIDFNNKKAVSSSNLSRLENKYALKQIIGKDTRITESTSPRIDLLFTDMSNIIESGVINHNISDHLPIFLIKKKDRNRIRKKEAMGRSYLNYDKDVFLRLLRSSSWAKFDNASEPQILWELFQENVEKVLDTVCPIKALKVVDNKPEWLSNDILISMRHRDKAFKKARRTKKQEDWDWARDLRNRLGMDIKTAKANVIKAKLERHGNNPKKFWEEINKLLPRTNDSTIMNLYDENLGTEIEGQELNGHINEYFSTIGSKLANECTPGTIITGGRSQESLQ